ncbi:MAG TPA: glycosyltransferase [Patescibacteria group bacterium]|nr:glycosyltransferase [Patescibacteria group bacterium]
MKIGIDISQLAYPKTGVATYLHGLVQHLIQQDKKNHYVLFYSSMRKGLTATFAGENVTLKEFRLPPTLLTILWNTLHIFPIEWFIGRTDIFISSDWTQPPTSAKKATILYDLIVYKYPEETSQKIIAVQKKKLAWVKKEVDKILCISKATKKDAEEILGIPDQKLTVVYPGL